MQPLSGTNCVFNFDPHSVKYNIILVWDTPCGGFEPKREIGRTNPEPVEWERACQWVHGMLRIIGKGDGSAKYQDIYLEPADIPRPWTPELYNLFLREIRQDALTQLLRRNARESRFGLDEAMMDTASQAEYIRTKREEINSIMGWW